MSNLINTNSALERFKKKMCVEKRNIGDITSPTERFIHKQKNRNDLGHVTLIIDGTASMSDLWNEVKQQATRLLSLINEILPDTQMSILIYNESGIRDALQPTKEVDELKNFVTSLDVQGGNSMQTHTEALEAALLEYSNSKSSFAIIMGDAAPNINDIFSRAMNTICSNNKNIYAVGVKTQSELYNSMYKNFMDITRRTDGKYFDLENMDDLVDVLSAMFAIKVNKVDELKNIWNRSKNRKINSKIMGLLTQ